MEPIFSDGIIGLAEDLSLLFPSDRGWGRSEGSGRRNSMGEDCSATLYFVDVD